MTRAQFVLSALSIAAYLVTLFLIAVDPTTKWKRR